MKVKIKEPNRSWIGTFIAVLFAIFLYRYWDRSFYDKIFILFISVCIFLYAIKLVLKSFDVIPVYYEDLIIDENGIKRILNNNIEYFYKWEDIDSISVYRKWATSDHFNIMKSISELTLFIKFKSYVNYKHTYTPLVPVRIYQDTDLALILNNATPDIIEVIKEINKYHYVQNDLTAA